MYLVPIPSALDLQSGDWYEVTAREMRKDKGYFDM